MNLTKEEKIAFYQQALESFTSRLEGPYICNVLKCLCRDAGHIVPSYIGSASDFCKENFPEFFKQVGVRCWPNSPYGNRQRITALVKAIKLCNK